MSISAELVYIGVYGPFEARTKVRGVLAPCVEDPLVDSMLFIVL